MQINEDSCVLHFLFASPVPTRDASAECDEPTNNCTCELTQPPVLPDVCDASTQCNFDADSYAVFKCPDFYSGTVLLKVSQKPKTLLIPPSKNFAFKCSE